MNDLGWIHLQVTDTLLTEIGARQDEAAREQLFDQTSEFIIVQGPMVVGHSMVDGSVVASDEDAARHAQVDSLMWPGHDRKADGADATRTGRTRFRDALHVATSIR